MESDASEHFSPSPRNRRVAARVGVVLGALAGLALTVPFALAFHEAYGSGGAAGFVPAGVSPWLFEHGWLGGDPKAVYDRYGVAYLAALGLVAASLFVLARPIRGGGRVILVGLVVLCVGIMGDYAVPNNVVGGVGFLLEGIGFLVVAVGVGLVARGRAGTLLGAGASLGTLACMVAGGAVHGPYPRRPRANDPPRGTHLRAPCRREKRRSGRRRDTRNPQLNRYPSPAPVCGNVR